MTSSILNADPINVSVSSSPHAQFVFPASQMEAIKIVFIMQIRQSSLLLIVDFKERGGNLIKLPDQTTLTPLLNSAAASHCYYMNAVCKTFACAETTFP